VQRILASSIKFDYGIINCMHRIAIELLKIDGFSVEAEVIERTGRQSMSFYTSLLLLEETIIHGNSIKNFEVAKVDKSNNELAENCSAEQGLKKTKSRFGSVTSASKNYWFSLIQLYELVGNEDALKGIWSSISQSQHVMLKAQVSLNNETMKLAKMIQDV
jgi:hypothetical protein